MGKKDNKMMIYLVTSCMALARWPTLPEVTPAMEMRPS